MINTVGVIGLGTMGAGIVEVFAKAGLNVVAVDGSMELADRGRGFVESSLGRAVKKGKLSEDDKNATLERIQFGDELGAMRDADLVIEAVPERMELKTSIFTNLDAIVGENCVLATNTSSLSVTEIAQATKDPSRVIGMHFFNPAPVLALVEVIYSLVTRPDLVDEVRELAERLGKKPVVVADRPGFVANALLVAYIARAIRHFENGLSTREGIDAAMSAGVGLPMGPLTLCDLIGLDVIHEVCGVLFDATRDPSNASPVLLRQKVAAGQLGRKTGKGFYTYASANSGQVVDDDLTPKDASAFSGSVGIVATGAEEEIAQQLAEQLKSAGLDVRTVSSNDDVDQLKGTSLTLVIDDGAEATVCGEGCACDDPTELNQGLSIDEKPLLRAVRDAIGDDGVVAALGAGAPASVATGDPVIDATIVPVVLHERQKAGQVLEIGRSVAINDDAVDAVRGFAAAAGLTPVVGKDRAGLVVDALLYPHLNDAVKMLDSGYASVNDIDTAMKAGCGYPKGPFELLDEVGIEDVVEVLEAIHHETGEQNVVPSALLLDYQLADLEFRG